MLWFDSYIVVLTAAVREVRMFERFTEDAITSIMLAQEEARADETCSIFSDAIPIFWGVKFD